jgi:protein-S-isoprenylcysteine O-methyltransferase
MVVFGHYFRSGAMIEASTSFNHYVQYKKADDHTLITSGVYQYSRHPSYFGFFYWCIGNQLLCFNPISATAFSVVLYKFFSERIQVEERYLVNFFGKEYEDYRSKVPTRLPFIN